MASKFELEGLLQPPEFEHRCNNFVAEVEKTVVHKYPDLGIHPVNFTTDLLDNRPERLREENTDIKKKKTLPERASKLYRMQEDLSAHINTAVVEIWGWKGEESIPQVKLAIDEINRIASKFSGTQEHTIEEIAHSITDKALPSTHLSYAFWSKEFEHLKRG